MTVPLFLPFVRPAALGLSLMLCAAVPGTAVAQSRAELLYGNHCLACHSTQMHWREKGLVSDWPSLRAQVRRWQAADQLAWSDDDIELVAVYLNELFYRLPPPARVVASGPSRLSPPLEYRP